MRNITITLPDELAQRLRVEAAKADKSVSKFVGELVEGRIGRCRSQAEALASFLSGPTWKLTDENGNLPSKEELYGQRDEELFRRHQHLSLSEGTASNEEK